MKAMEWIDVNDELPPNDEKVEVLMEVYITNNDYLKDEIISQCLLEGTFNRRSGWMIYLAETLNFKINVTHWRNIEGRPKMKYDKSQ